MRLIGHRGCPVYAPENTVAAVRRAVPHVDAVEIDVQQCSTGELVVFHDKTLDRLTEGSGRVRETPWRDLRELVVCETDTVSERRERDERNESAVCDDTTIPLLSELLAAVPTDVAVNVELKHGGAAAEVADSCEHVPNDVFVSSFLPEALSELGEVSDLYTALLFAGSWKRNLDTATELGCRYLHPEYRLCLDDPGRIQTAHDAGFEVNGWTVPTASDAEQLVLDGVDGLIVDDWAIV
ncbi:glycerophosphodiester phosphodiesterase [Haloprofundus salinisoli]|uniref:glycerophosphodiester phosphodiesterase n=1 Tax=Haloprofundus salinisoli TaxID=2876193 RepID=UPI001CCA86E2|nr:glycerophosphodiester phosphodiesterase [Haloprofundus salinisoli]